MPSSIKFPDSLFFSDLAKETHFYLIRHGQSHGNAKNIIQGRQEFELDDSGRAQALGAGIWFNSIKIDSFLCSTQARAQETANIISHNSKLPKPKANSAFVEIDTGCFSGRTLKDVEETMPEVFAAFKEKSWDAVPEAESSHEIAFRVYEAWKILRSEALEGHSHIAVVSHGGFIQWMVRATFGVSSWSPHLATGNCGIFHLVITPHKESPHIQWRLLNHIPESGIKTIAPVF